MKILVNKINKVIVTKGSLCEIRNDINAIEIEPNSFVSPIEAFDIYDVSDTLSFQAQKNCYDGQSVYDNPDYVAPGKPIELQVQELQSQNAQMLLALVNGGLM